MKILGHFLNIDRINILLNAYIEVNGTNTQAVEIGVFQSKQYRFGQICGKDRY